MGVVLAVLLSAAAPPPPAGRTLIGRYGPWAAFRAEAPRACFAVAEPQERSGGKTPPFLAFARRPGMAAPIALHLRLSRARQADKPVMLTIGERRFTLRAQGQEAWAQDDRDDRRILAALRHADQIDVTATGVHGHHFTDSYALVGGPSAIDAAILACLQS